MPTFSRNQYGARLGRSTPYRYFLQTDCALPLSDYLGFRFVMTTEMARSLGPTKVRQNCRERKDQYE